jgi:hypothetical protein
MGIEIKPGQIGIAEFPLAEAAGGLKHPVLIMSVETALSGMQYAWVAYGSSKKVSRTGHLNHEFVLSPEDGEAFRKAGLKKATRFDLMATARIPCRSIRVIGFADLEDPAIYNRLRDATFAAQ